MLLAGKRTFLAADSDPAAAPPPIAALAPATIATQVHEPSARSIVRCTPSNPASGIIAPASAPHRAIRRTDRSAMVLLRSALARSNPKPMPHNPPQAPNRITYPTTAFGNHARAENSPVAKKPQSTRPTTIPIRAQATAQSSPLNASAFNCRTMRIPRSGKVDLTTIQPRQPRPIPPSPTAMQAKPIVLRGGRQARHGPPDSSRPTHPDSARACRSSSL